MQREGPRGQVSSRFDVAGCQGLATEACDDGAQPVVAGARTFEKHTVVMGAMGSALLMHGDELAEQGLFPASYNSALLDVVTKFLDLS